MLTLAFDCFRVEESNVGMGFATAWSFRVGNQAGITDEWLPHLLEARRSYRISPPSFVEQLPQYFYYPAHHLPRGSQGREVRGEGGLPAA
jgi:hypothetical protein